MDYTIDVKVTDVTQKTGGASLIVNVTAPFSPVEIKQAVSLGAHRLLLEMAEAEMQARVTQLDEEIRVEKAKAKKLARENEKLEARLREQEVA